MKYVYKKWDKIEAYVVGFYEPDGKFIRESDHDSQDDAVMRVSYLNGNPVAFPTKEESLNDAKEHLKKNWKDGTICPCCNQVVKLYEIKISAKMAKVLMDMGKLTSIGKEWIHIMNDLKTQDGTYAKMRFWGLIEPMGDTIQVKLGIKKSSGYWKLTDRGKKFILGSTSLPESKFIFNNHSYQNPDWKPKYVTIKDALKNKFNYAEMMRGFAADITPRPFNDQPSLF